MYGRRARTPARADKLHVYIDTHNILVGTYCVVKWGKVCRSLIQHTCIKDETARQQTL